jgi:hypothetical protein
VEHHRHSVAVVPQVHQLVPGVAVVRIDRYEREFEAGEQCFEVLGAAVHVLGNLVLPSDPGAEQQGGKTIGASVELGPRVATSAVHGRLGAGETLGVGLPDIGHVPSVLHE